MPYPNAYFTLLSVLLAFAAASDVATHRIPNVVAVAIAATGLGAQLVTEGFRSAGSGLAGALVVAALLWTAWARRMIGGGDLKVAAAAAIWLGIHRLPTYLVATGIAAGALAVVSYAASSVCARAEMRRNLFGVAIAGHAAGPVPITGERGRVVVPAGAAFAAGAICALVLGGTP